jgi:alkylhydroperoxidase family enzyme
MTLAGWMARQLGWAGVKRTSGRHAVVGYLALSRLPGFGGTLDSRTALLAGGLAAQLSGCRWCIDRTGHDWRMAGLPVQLLDQLGAYSSSSLFTDRERAALAFVETVARSPVSVGDMDRARAILSEVELAELTAIVAEHHCVERITSNRPAS